MVQDYSAFYSHFRITGTLTSSTAIRVGAGDNRGATEQDLPVLKDLAGRPYIPGSSMKGVFRSHLERLLRSFDPSLACVSVPWATGLGGSPGCLTQEDIDAIKRKYANKPDAELSQAILEGTTLTPKDEPLLEKELKLTGLCWTCRLCGAPWFASKLMIADSTVVDETWFGRYQIRDGVGIDRDTETVAQGLYFNYEAVPAGTQFQFEMMIDNADDAELGLALLGLREFEDGLVTLGGGRSRGLGHVALKLDWDHASWVDRTGLRDYLLNRATISLAKETERRKYWQAFLNAINETGGAVHA